jgi:transcriptional regulator with XRE-family HTH domain
MKSLGLRIESHRKLLRITQVELGRLAGLDQTVISKLERGEVQETTKIAQLARALKVDAYWLATGDGNESLYYPATQEGKLAAKLIDSIDSGVIRQKAVKIIDTLSEPHP